MLALINSILNDALRGLSAFLALGSPEMSSSWCKTPPCKVRRCSSKEAVSPWLSRTAAKDSHLSNSMDSPSPMSCLLATHSVMLHGAGPRSRLQAASLSLSSVWDGRWCGCRLVCCSLGKCSSVLVGESSKVWSANAVTWAVFRKGISTWQAQGDHFSTNLY